MLVLQKKTSMKYELSKFFLLVTIITALTSCKRNKNPKDDGYYSQDFENFSQWLGESPSITNEFSRSGEFCTKMDSSNSYSQSFAKKMSEIKEKGYKKVKIRVWGALSNTSARCKLIVSVNTDEKTYYWNGTPFNEFISKPKEWGQIMTEVDLDKYPGEGYLKVYAIIDGKEKAYMDDVEIQFSK